MRDRSLRRAVDRVEDAVAWLMTAVGIVVVIAAIVLGYDGYGTRMERVVAEQATRVQVMAELLPGPPRMAIEPDGGRALVLAPARWTDRAGRQHDGAVLVRPSAGAGHRIPVWINEKGEPSRPPADRLSAVLDGIGVGIGVLVTGCGLVGFGWIAARRAIFAYNTRRWGQEWARVGPEWTSQQST